jgi:hydrogenase nickel incorporation protein HypB
MVKYEIMKDALSKDKSIAKRNRKLFKDKGIIAINIMGSPGSGKTTLIKRLLESFKDFKKCGVIEADLATTIDAEALKDYAYDVFQINTSGVCHLTAEMIERAIKQMDIENIDILLIENVGNLVCPSAFDLGEILRVGLISSPEGDDKPAKYPSLFYGLDAVIITKADLLNIMDFNSDRVIDDALRIKSTIKPFIISAKNNKGIKELVDWILEFENKE